MTRNGESTGEPMTNDQDGNATEEFELKTDSVSLDELVAERNRYKDQLLRAAADFENFRKRSRRDLEDGERRSREDLLMEILPVFDNLERAVAAANSATSVQAVAEGVHMVLKLFQDIGTKVGLERVQSVGERFDPNLHDAVQQVETMEHAPGTIINEITPGYRLGGKLLRPAMVVLARPVSSGNGQGA